MWAGDPSESASDTGTRMREGRRLGKLTSSPSEKAICNRH